MKKETRVRTYSRSEEVYVAEDGTTFCDSEECKKYEESAKFASKMKIIGKSLIYLPNGYQEKTTGAIYFGTETVLQNSDDYDIYLFKPETDEDVKLFIQWFKLCIPDFSKGKDWTKENFENLTERLLTDDSKKWNSYKPWKYFEDLEKGKKYIVKLMESEGWGNIIETESYKKVVTTVLDTIVEQFAK